MFHQLLRYSRLPRRPPNYFHELIKKKGGIYNLFSKGDSPRHVISREMSLRTTNDDNRDLDSFLSQGFLDLEKIDENCYRSKKLWKLELARGTYGGQLIGQAMVAASMSVPEDKHLHSFHSYFLAPGNCDVPMVYFTESTRDGRTYASRKVKAQQNGRMIFTMEASFKVNEDSAFSYQHPMMDVPSYNEIPEFQEVLKSLEDEGSASDLHVITGKDWFYLFPIEIKWVNTEDSLFKSPREPRRRFWFRTKGHISKDVHHNIHKCCLGYMTDIFLVHTSLLPYAPLDGKKIFQASLDHCMWFHFPCRADDWMLFETRTESTGDCRTFIHGLIWDRQGRLVTTVTQEAVHRVISGL